jgi:hypothetical protein
LFGRAAGSVREENLICPGAWRYALVIHQYLAVRAPAAARRRARTVGVHQLIRAVAQAGAGEDWIIMIDVAPVRPVSIRRTITRRVEIAAEVRMNDHGARAITIL